MNSEKEPCEWCDGTGVQPVREGDSLQVTRFAWLLEKPIDGVPAYWDGGHAESFTRNANNAIQWCRKMDAFVSQRVLLQPSRWGWEIVEHGFMGDASSQAEGWHLCTPTQDVQEASKPPVCQCEIYQTCDLCRGTKLDASLALKGADVCPDCKTVHVQAHETPLYEQIAIYVEHLRDGWSCTTEPVRKVAKLIRDRFGPEREP